MIRVEVDDDKVREELDSLPAEVMDAAWDELVAGGLNVESGAKKRCPVRKVPVRINGQLYSGGRLRSSIHTIEKKDERTVSVGTNVHYGPYVEHGTVRMKAQPFLNPALEAERGPLLRRLEETIQKALGGGR